MNKINLQETHLIPKDLIMLKQLELQTFNSWLKIQSLGVMIIFNNDFEYKIHNVNKDNEGRFMKKTYLSDCRIWYRHIRHAHKVPVVMSMVIVGGRSCAQRSWSNTPRNIM